MCDTDGSFTRARVMRCACGKYHLTLGAVTLNLSEDELVLVARTIHAMAGRHPELRAKLEASLCADQWTSPDA